MSSNKYTDYKNTFESLITQYSWWARMRGSQFIEMIATFVGQMVFKAEQACARYLQEGFLSTAINRASILAAAEDRGYIGRKKMPSTGTVEITNITTGLITLPLNTALISNAAIQYVLTQAVEIPAGSTVQVPISQLVLKVFQTTITTDAKFQEILLSKAVTADTHRIDVYVAPPGAASELWTKTYMLRRTNSTSKAYTEFYKPTEQLGIRFGNGVNGKIPAIGSVVTLNVWTTEGDSTLIVNQPLEAVGDYAYLNDSVTIKTVTPIVGGAAAESDEETRAGALYVTPFDNQIVWNDDYSHFLGQNLANLTWVNAWGEQEQEQQAGGPDFNFVNKIFVSCYSATTDQATLETMVIDLLTGTDYLNKRYEYVPANERPFTITITGTATGEKDLVQVKKAISDAITAVYGRDPDENARPTEILEKDVNALVRDLSLLYDFSLSWANYPQNILLEDYIYIDVENSTISLSYVETR